MNRYQRHSLIDWFDQSRLKEAKIIVVGAGAVGNEVLKNLTLLGVGNISIFDFDKIEEHNLTRCVLFNESDVGRYKAEVAANTCRLIDPNVKIVHQNIDFWQGLSFEEIEKSDAVICCVDNFEARLGLNQLCMIVNTDFYNTGIDSRYSSVELFPFSLEPDCACYECGIPHTVYTSLQKRFSCGWLKKIAYKEKKIPTTTITSSISGAFVVSILLNRLNKHEQSIQGAVRCFHDSISLQSTISLIQRKDDCPSCQRYGEKFERIVTKRICLPENDLKFDIDENIHILLSEPVVLYGKCKLCDKVTNCYESTKYMTDSAIFCKNCKSNSINLKIVERMPVEEFEQLFYGKKVPCKYLIYQTKKEQLIFELEG